jgi:AAA family ATP:ADP antiporter
MSEAVEPKSFWRFGVVHGETRAVAWSFAYFFFVLASYYVLRPVRDEMGIRSGVGNLPWLFTATFFVSLAIAPLYSALVARLPRKRFVPIVYGFLLLNILAFWICLRGNIAVTVLTWVFFVWITVFAVFAVSVFWSFMADLYSNEQAKRLFPTIAAGGAIGGFAGSASVVLFVNTVGPTNLLLIAGALLACAMVCAMNLETTPGLERNATRREQEAEPVGGGWLTGIITLVRSAYLGKIGLWVLGMSLAGALSYNLQAQIISDAGLDSARRTQIFGSIDLAANFMIPLIQLFITRPLMRRFGLGLTLSVITIVGAAGFIGLAIAPVLAVVVAFQIAGRTAQYAISNPAREALWTVVDREDKYKTKNVVDMAVFRGADLVGSWLLRGLTTAGLSVPIISAGAVPVMGAFFWLSIILGRDRARRAAAQDMEESK